MGWEVLGVGEPVVGEVSDYEFASGELESLRSAAESVRDQFGRISADGVGECRGQAAEQLAELIGGVDGALRDLPVVVGDVAGIFSRHGHRLEDLKRRADEALARAEARWNELQRARAAHGRADRRLDYLRGQLQSLDFSAVSVDAAAAQQAHLAARVSAQSSRVQACERAVEAAGYELELSEAEHGRLQDEEQGLVGATVAALGGVDLRSLQNPGWLDKVGGWVADAFGGVLRWAADGVGDLANMVGAILDGDFGAALWYLRDFLDKFTLVLVAVAVVTILVISGGLAIPGLIAFALVGASVAQAASSFSLFLMGTPHPETGERIGLFDLALDFIAVVPTAKSFKAIQAITSRLKALPKGTFAVDRPFRPILVNLWLLRRARTGASGLHGPALDSHVRRITIELKAQWQVLKELMPGELMPGPEDAALAGAEAIERQWQREQPATDTQPDQVHAAASGADTDPAAGTAYLAPRPADPHDADASKAAAETPDGTDHRPAGHYANLQEFFTGSRGQITSLDEFWRRGVSMHNDSASYQLCPR